MKKPTTILVDTPTREKLVELFRGRDNYDTVINRLLSYHESTLTPHQKDIKQSIAEMHRKKFVDITPLSKDAKKAMAVK